jgi:SWIM zinc finger
MTPAPASRSKPHLRRTPALCRLWLRINGTDYGVRRIGDAPAAVLEAWRLTKCDGTTYDVGRTADGYTCDCPDYDWRRGVTGDDVCKHVLALKAVGLLSEMTNDRDR